ncbi:MAG: hypothetical protein HC812_06195 [Leptolyngbya sp. RL_3_1]|nr:hypothetical protein [Leptolyngbya sp. RL_3_1]
MAMDVAAAQSRRCRYYAQRRSTLGCQECGHLLPPLSYSGRHRSGKLSSTPPSLFLLGLRCLGPVYN